MLLQIDSDLDEEKKPKNNGPVLSNTTLESRGYSWQN